MQDVYELSIQLAERNNSLNAQVSELSGEVVELQEDMLKIADAFDNFGYSPLESAQTQEIPLKTVKQASSVGRNMYMLNPFIKRGVDARIAYIWGRGVNFDGIDKIQNKMDLNRRVLFGPQVYEELERTLATDGNVFTSLPVGVAEAEKKTAFRIPLVEISNAVSNPENIEEIWMYKRSWSIRTTDGKTGAEDVKEKHTYYLSVHRYKQLKESGKALPKTWRGVPVSQEYVLHHMTVNRQVGWRWGIPDTMPVVFWARAYKEYLEDSAGLVKAYNRLAWNYKAPNLNAANAAAASIMQTPTRDPITGELNSVGGTAINPGTLTPMPNNASTVDFDKGAALAAAIAAGLGLPKHVVTSDAGGGNRATAETLDLPTLKTMETRQQLHSERFYDLFEFWGAKVSPLKIGTGVTEITEEAKAKADHATVTWAQIETETTKDRISALGTAVELQILYKEEARKEALETFGIAPFRPWNDLPKPEDDLQNEYDEKLAKEAIKVQEKQSVIPAQGVSGGISAEGGALGTKNSARDNRKEDTGK